MNSEKGTEKHNQRQQTVNTAKRWKVLQPYSQFNWEGARGDRKESITKDNIDIDHGKGATYAVESTGQAQDLKKVPETLHPSSTALTKGV